MSHTTETRIERVHRPLAVGRTPRTNNRNHQSHTQRDRPTVQVFTWQEEGNKMIAETGISNLSSRHV